MSSTSLPPLATDYVFAIPESIMIDAPCEKVWSILLDGPAYYEWNPFVRRQTAVDENKIPLQDQTPRVGSYLLLSPIHIPPTMEDKPYSSSSVKTVLKLDHDNYRLAWAGQGLPSWWLYTERWQVLTKDESGKTKYDSIDCFSGIAAYIIKWFFRSGFAQGFRAQAEALKQRAEKQT